MRRLFKGGAYLRPAAYSPWARRATIIFLVHAFLGFFSLNGVIRMQKKVVAPRLSLRKILRGRGGEYDIVQNLSSRVSLERKFNSEHISHKNNGPKIYSLEDRKP